MDIYSEYDIKSLTIKAKEKNLEAFEEVYNFNVPKIYALCLRMTSDDELSNRLTKEIFLDAWKNLSNYDEQISFELWVTTIAVKRIIAGVKNTTNKDIVEDKTNSSVNIVESKLICLQEMERLIFILYDIEKFSFKDITFVTSMTIKEVKTLLIKARLKLLREIR